MNAEELKAFYLAKMHEAEKLASRIKDQDQKERWLSIAEGYRILAHARFPARQQ
jgi:hypothetical protein